MRTLRSDRGSGSVGSAIMALVVIAGCWYFWSDIKPHIPFLGPDRNVANYCKTFKDEGDRLHQQWADQQKAAGDNPFAAAGMVFGSFGDMATFFNKLAEVSPDEIQPDVQSEADAFAQMKQRLGDNPDPISVMLSGLVTGLQQSGAEQRVDTYTTQNCAPPIGRKGVSNALTGASN